MRTRNTLIALLTLVIFVSCKDEKNPKTEDAVVAETPKETFKVGLDLVIKKDDSLQIYYKDQGMTDWVFDKCVTKVVKGSDQVQEVIFNLPEDVLPSELRFDMGTNKSQGEVEIKSFKMNYLDKTFVAKDTLFFQYFYPNDQIDYNRSKAIAKPIVKANTPYDPIFISREVLTNEINKIIK